MSDRYHMSLGLSRELWNDLLRAALPVKVVDGEFDLATNARSLVRQLQVRQRVAGLLEDRQPPELVRRAGNRARAVWRKRRGGVYRRISDAIRLEGTYRVELDAAGTEFRYGVQKVSADAFVKGIAEGKLTLLGENIELPFVIEKRLGASVTLGDIRYDESHKAVIGSLGELALHIGDPAVVQLLSRLGEYLLQQQLPRVNPLPILKRDQVEEMVGSMGGALRVQMGVEDLKLEITEDDMTLKVRFGFSQLQLEDRAAERA